MTWRRRAALLLTTLVMIKDRATQVGGAFTLRHLVDEFSATGIIPVSLIRRQLLGAKGAVAGPPLQ